jgi:hypothetical protein
MTRRTTTAKRNAQRFNTGGAVTAESPADTTVNIMAAPEAAEDDASAAFKVQIANQRRAEQLQRAKDSVNRMLNENPAMMQHQGLTQLAEREALREGLDPLSDEFHQAVKRNFYAKYDTGEQPEQPPIDAPKASHTADVEPSEPRRSVMTSAPVSREGTQATGSYNAYGERPGQVHMTVAMKEAAKIAGITEREYAENVLRLRAEKKAGNYGGQA